MSLTVSTQYDFTVQFQVSTLLLFIGSGMGLNVFTQYDLTDPINSIIYF